MKEKFMSQEELVQRAGIISQEMQKPWYGIYGDEILQRREILISQLKRAKKEDAIWKIAGKLEGFDYCASIFEDFADILHNYQKEQESPEGLDE